MITGEKIANVAYACVLTTNKQERSILHFLFKEFCVEMSAFGNEPFATLDCVICKKPVDPFASYSALPVATGVCCADCDSKINDECVEFMQLLSPNDIEAVFVACATDNERVDIMARILSESIVINNKTVYKLVKLMFFSLCSNFT